MPRYLICESLKNSKMCKRKTVVIKHPKLSTTSRQTSVLYKKMIKLITDKGGNMVKG